MYFGRCIQTLSTNVRVVAFWEEQSLYINFTSGLSQKDCSYSGRLLLTRPQSAQEEVKVARPLLNAALF